MITTDKVFELFRTLNSIPRPSHHEEKVADFLCQYAESLGLEYDRDKENCVVIRKPATPGHENAEPVVLLNHMDMVAVGDGSRSFDPLNDGIEAYVEDGWMKARGTSLGADVDVLGFSPKKVAMHFVLEAGYYVQKFPGIEIACIGPRIIEPHSVKERVELSTVDNI